MIHARDDYNRMQDPALDDPDLLSPGSTPIGTDEPVVLFRAQDRHMIAVLEHYRDLVDADEHQKNETARLEVTEALDDHLERVRAWQAAHGCKSPDL
jgi:hypothetical protein